MKRQITEDSSKNLSPCKRFIFIIIVIILPLGVILFSAELLFRYIESREMISIMRPNPYGSGSHRLKENFYCSRTIHGHRIQVHTNQHGMHWYPVEYLPSPNRKRIAFVGDSFTFGCWADDFMCSFVGIFDSLAQTRGYEALNFGVGGYGLDEMELIINEEVFNFHPSYVVIMFFNGNDFRDTYLGMDKYELRNGTLHWKKDIIKKKLPPEDWPLQLKDDESQQRRIFISWLKTHSAVARRVFKLSHAIVDRLHHRRQSVSKEPDSSSNKGITINENFTSFTYWSQIPYPPLAIRAKELSLASLERIRVSVENNGARLIIVSIPYSDQVFVSDMVGANYNIHLPQDFVRDFANKRDIGYLDLLPVLREHIQNGGKNPYISGDPHFNDVGHRLVGERLAEWFLAEGKGN